MSIFRQALASYFYPRSPCGERLGKLKLNIGSLKFLSTLSLRRATKKLSVCKRTDGISIHALLAESDANKGVSVWLLSYFYPRSPCGERQVMGCSRNAHARDFYPRSPCGERLQLVLYTCVALAISIHALLAESDLSLAR